jgi:hypothetical protein
MADVIELGKFAGLVRPSSGTAPINVQPSEEGRWSRSSDLGGSQGFLSAAAVRKLDDESPIGKVLELVEQSHNPAPIVAASSTLLLIASRSRELRSNFL